MSYVAHLDITKQITYIVPSNYPPTPVAVTTRNITSLVGNPELNLHWPLASWVRGVDPKYTLPRKLQHTPISHTYRSAIPLANNERNPDS